MDVRCAAADGIEQQLVDEAHDGRVFDVVTRYARAFGVVVATGDIEVLEIEAGLIFGELRHGRVGLLGGLVDGLLQLVVFDDHGLDAEAGLEFDFVDGVQVGGIRDAEEQALAAAIQRQAAVLLQQLVLHQLDDVEIDLVRVQVIQRHAEFGGSRDSDVARLGGAGGNELGDEAGFAVFGRLQCREHRGFFDHAILDQTLRQAAEPRSIPTQR
jgi:hypothetical protein